MRKTQSQLFFGVRVLYLAFVIILMVGFPGGGATFTTSLTQGIVGIAIAYFIVTSYERAKNWARIWMLIALYLSTALYLKDAYDFASLVSLPGFGGWGGFGLLVDLACVVASIVAIIRVHREGEVGLETHVPQAPPE